MSDHASTTAGELASLCGGSLTDSAGLEGKAIRRVATVQEAGGDAVTWIGDEKHANLLAACQAGAIIGTEALLGDDRRGIIVADPELAIARVLDWFLTPNEPPAPGIHPTAVVHEAALLGSNVRVGAWALVAAEAAIGDDTIIHEGVSVGRAVRIGRRCQIYDRCVIYDRCEIGERVTVHAGTVIGADGFGYIFREGRHRRLAHVGTVIIEDDVEIGANVCVDRAKTGATRIGRGCKIDNLVQIAHNVQLGPSCVLVGHVALAGSARLGTGVVMGGHSGVGENVAVGDGVRVGAQSSVMRNVAAGRDVIGTPARDRTAVLRDQARVHKLPKWFAEIAELERRVAELEAAADSQEHR